MPDKNIQEMSSVEKAIVDFEEIMNEAQSFAKEKVLSEMDEKMDSIVKEFINNKKESVKTKVNESVKKDQESVQADKKKEMSKSKVNETLDLTTASINEIEAAFDQAGNLDELEVVKDSMDLSGNGLDLASDGENTNLANDEMSDDELSIDDIKSELDSIEGIEPDLQGTQQDEAANNDPYLKMKKMHEELGNMLKEMENEIQESELKNTFTSKMSEMYGEGYEQKLGIAECGKMFETWKSNVTPAEDNGDVANASATKGKEDKTMVAEEEVDESHGITLAHNKKVGQNVLPRDGKDYAKNKFRIALQKESAEHTKKLTAVLKENKELNKKLNELKSERKQLAESNAKINSLNVKMKDQMKEMAVFNTNIAYTNNLLVNENLALTKEEKSLVIDKFKTVKTISESESTYKTLLEEFKSSKKKINESLDATVSAGSIIGESSVKAIEKTAYDPYAKIKNMIIKMDKKK